MPELPIDHGVIVEAPNTALLAMHALAMLQTHGATLASSATVSIIESHQATKGETVSGTALAIARYLGRDERSIRHVRDTDEQIDLGIPTEHLQSHGYHWVTIERDGVVLRLSIEIRGRSAYARGAITLAKSLLARDVP